MPFVARPHSGGSHDAAAKRRRVRVFMVYNLFPDFQDVNSWRRRGRILLFGIFKNKDSKDIKNQLQKQGCADGSSASAERLMTRPPVQRVDC